MQGGSRVQFYGAAVIIIIIALIQGMIVPSQGTEYFLTPDTPNWQTTLQNLQAGDTANLNGALPSPPMSVCSRKTKFFYPQP